MADWLDIWLLPLIMLGLASVFAFVLLQSWLVRFQAQPPAPPLLLQVVLQAMPLAVALQTQLVRELTHYHTPRMDALLQKLGPPITLTPAEMAELQAAILEREGDMGAAISPEERDAAHILPVVIQRAQRESVQVTTMPILAQLVLIPQYDSEVLHSCEY